MPIRLNYRIPKFIKFLLIIVASVSFSLVINSSALEVVNRPTKVLDKSSFSTQSKNLKDNDPVNLKGSINYLRVISDQNGDNYYVGFEDFGDLLIAKLSKANLEGSSTKSIFGSIKIIRDTQFGDDLISKLNEPGNINDLNNSKLSGLDANVKEKIAESLKGSFAKESVLFIEGNEFQREQVYFETVLLGILSAVFLIVLLREQVLFS